jgi:protein-tyrosine-phosphatase
MEKKYKILFLCVQNAGRSQMAEAFAREILNDIVEPYSAGSRPANEVNPLVVEAMKEVGIDISDKKPKGFDDLPKGMIFDFVVNMGCGDTCPYYPSRGTIDWNIPDPKDKELEEIKKIRDLIRDKIIELGNYLRALSGDR